MGFGGDALKALPVAPVTAIGATSARVGRGLAKGRGNLLVMARVREACERERSWSLAYAKQTRVFDVANCFKAAHLAMDEVHVRNSCCSHRRGDKSPARARPFERRDLRRAQPVQFSVNAGEAVAYSAEDPEFPLARGANICSGRAAQCKTRNPLRSRTQIWSSLPKAALGGERRRKLAGRRNVRSNELVFGDEQLLRAGKLGHGLALRRGLQTARRRSVVPK